MKAELVHDFKDITPDGGIIQMIVWKVPTPVPPTTHGFKYRLVENSIAEVDKRRK